ncbi:MAG TPA: YeeE/YedE thiosulfate transporter family protein [Polyangiaceae bacterium]|jgi:hypothetical protein
MSAPFDLDAAGPLVARTTAVLIGVGFGGALERAGLGEAPKLAGQFYRTDFTVLRVMFSAVTTAMLGVFWLGRLGMLDVARLEVPETRLAAQLAGGLVFGSGFVVGGLCPGTSCVAAATGRLDGLAVFAGMFLGVLAFGLGADRLRPLYEGGARGAWTVASLLHVPYGVAVCAIVLAALGAFRIAYRLERP